MRYENRLADFEIDGWDGARIAMSATGAFPIDLSLAVVEDRLVDAPLDMRIEADSLDAAIALAYVTSLEGVLGTVSGEVWVSGTPRSPQPQGTMTLSNGAWSVEAIGVRHTEVNGEFRLNSDQITLLPFTDPLLNLNFTFTRFQAVARADMEGLISGGFRLTGRYRRPVAQGEVVVDEGTIFVDELQRAAGIVDLTDSFLFDEGLAVDTTALVSQPIVAGFQNPFFDNLRVDVDMSVPRGSWLRSLESDIELSGDLLVRYDRSANDFVLIGQLEAVRGSHLVLGRSFELDGGTVDFIGRPGLNPDLDIQASSRIRRPDEPPFVVNAQVDGSLVRPIVTLTTDETGLAEEDLVSYLLFGQPSSALGGQSSAGLQQVQNSNALGSFRDAAVTYVGGALANQVGTAIARELSLDYVSRARPLCRAGRLRGTGAPPGRCQRSARAEHSGRCPCRMGTER
jgi:translocation and assembly module TamB